MNANTITSHCEIFLQNLAWIMKNDGYVLTDVQFYKGQEGMAHVEIRAKRTDMTDEGKPLWYVCALPLNLGSTVMQPSLENFDV